MSWSRPTANCCCRRPDRTRPPPPPASTGVASEGSSRSTCRRSTPARTASNRSVRARPARAVPRTLRSCPRTAQNPRWRPIPPPRYFDGARWSTAATAPGKAAGRRSPCVGARRRCANNRTRPAPASRAGS